MTQKLENAKHSYRAYDFILAGFVAVLLCSNLIGPAKLWQVNLGPLGVHVVGAGVLFFPISYLFNDVLTEVYGYARARRGVWSGLGAMIFASIMSMVVVGLPPADGWPHQEAYALVLGTTPRIAMASIMAYFCGEFVNSYVLAKLKVKTGGKHLWMRTIGSTVVGEAVDSIIFYPLAFYGVWPPDQMLAICLMNYTLKVLWEVVATPITYPVVAWLKRREHEDFFDRNTDFSPFKIKVE